MIGWIILAAILLFFVWLLFGPIRLKINTSRDQYEIILPGIVRAMIIPTDAFVIFKLWITAIPVKIDPLKPKKKKKKKPIKKKPEKQKKKNSSDVPVKKIRMLATRIMKSFTVEKIILNIDTGDYALNARLVPVFSVLSSNSRKLSINFQDVNHFELTIKNRISNFLKIAIKTFVFNL